MQSKTKQGFTIIEVVLVLAIAGLIFLMVFVALPALQRSQRDTQRRDDLARVATAITQYQTNNTGNLPAAGTCASSTTSATSFNPSTNTSAACRLIAKYLNSSTATTNEFKDPDGTAYGLVVRAFNTTDDTKNVPDNSYASGGNHNILMLTKAKCSGETAATSNNPREYAILYKLEGAGTYCADNQ